jgi:hypothetical protein
LPTDRETTTRPARCRADRAPARPDPARMRAGSRAAAGGCCPAGAPTDAVRQRRALLAEPREARAHKRRDARRCRGMAREQLRRLDAVVHLAEVGPARGALALLRVEPVEPRAGLAAHLLGVAEARAARQPIEHERQRVDGGTGRRVRLRREQARLLAGALFHREAAHEAIEPQRAPRLEQHVERHEIARTQRGLERSALLGGLPLGRGEVLLAEATRRDQEVAE